MEINKEIKLIIPPKKVLYPVSPFLFKVNDTLYDRKSHFFIKAFIIFINYIYKYNSVKLYK